MNERKAFCDRCDKRFLEKHMVEFRTSNAALLYSLFCTTCAINVAEEFVASAHKLHAFKLCKDIDEDDIPFIALSLQLDALFWTGDKRLKESLLRQGFTSFF